jgi:hypothetical protein
LSVETGVNLQRSLGRWKLRSFVDISILLQDHGAVWPSFCVLFRCTSDSLVLGYIPQINTISLKLPKVGKQTWHR